MAGPGDPVCAKNALAHGTKLLHRRLAAAVSNVDAKLDPTDPEVEGALQHHVLHAPVEAAAAQVRAIIGAADLQALPAVVDGDEARHASKLVAFEQDEGAVVGPTREGIDGLIEIRWPEIDRVDFPDVAVFRASGPQRVAMFLVEQLRPAAVAGHPLGKPPDVDHSSSRSCETFSERSRRSIWVPSSKLSSAMNFSFAAYLMRTRWATSR